MSGKQDLGNEGKEMIKETIQEKFPELKELSLQVQE